MSLMVLTGCSSQINDFSSDKECKEVVKIPKDFVCEKNSDCYNELYLNRGIKCNTCSVELTDYGDISDWTVEKRNNQQMPLNAFNWRCYENSCYCKGFWYTTN